MKTSTKRMKRTYDLHVLLRPYKEGDVVNLLDTATQKGNSTNQVLHEKVQVALQRITSESV